MDIHKYVELRTAQIKSERLAEAARVAGNTEELDIHEYSARYWRMNANSVYYGLEQNTLSDDEIAEAVARGIGRNPWPSEIERAEKMIAENVGE